MSRSEHKKSVVPESRRILYKKISKRLVPDKGGACLRKIFCGRGWIRTNVIDICKCCPLTTKVRGLDRDSYPSSRP